MPEPPLLCIMGPTAAGKTDFAVAAARALNGELISVDSALVYRGLNIGAAKPVEPHHLMDLRDPSDVYSVADFVSDARKTIAAVRSRGRLPILVGGTMLYFRALLQGLDDIPASDEATRATITQEAAEQGWPAMHRQLAQVDPVLAARLHPNHSQRIGRGLEVWRITGKPLSEWQQGVATDHLLEPALCLALCPSSRVVLHQRIESRFDQMLAEGFLDEVKGLYDRGDLRPELPAIRAVGYQQLWSVVAGTDPLELGRSKAIAATRQLAKRQLTWLRRWPRLNWLLSGDDLHTFTLQGELALTNSGVLGVIDKKSNGVETNTVTMMKIVEEALRELHKR